MAQSALVAEAVRKNAFARGFRRKVFASPDLAGEIDALMERDCLQALAIANKAGLVVTGFGKVEEAIASSAVAGVAHARDGAPDGLRKLEQILRRRQAKDGRNAKDEQNARPIIELFTSGQLDLSLGRTNVIHAVALAGPAGYGFVERCRRLDAYRSGAGAGPEASAQGPEPVWRSAPV